MSEHIQLRNLLKRGILVGDGPTKVGRSVIEKKAASNSSISHASITEEKRGRRRRKGDGEVKKSLGKRRKQECTKKSNTSAIKESNTAMRGQVNKLMKKIEEGVDKRKVYIYPLEMTSHALNLFGGK
jgi:hypothetical protein